MKSRAERHTQTMPEKYRGAVLAVMDATDHNCKIPVQWSYPAVSTAALAGAKHWVLLMHLVHSKPLQKLPKLALPPLNKIDQSLTDRSNYL